METIPICVLHKSETYNEDYVRRLAEGIDLYLPGYGPLRVITDSELSIHPKFLRQIPMVYHWKGWWSKMELFRPGLGSDMLYFDLDTMIIHPIMDIVEALRDSTGIGGIPVMLRDFYRPQGLGSGLMYLPKSCRPHVWDRWIQQPDIWMKEYRRGGDQAFLEKFWGGIPDKWQDLFPDRVVSYKADNIAALGVPPKASIVCFHGKPKPHDIKWDLSVRDPRGSGDAG